MKPHLCLLLVITSAGCTFKTPGLAPGSGDDMAGSGDGDMSHGGGGDMKGVCSPGATFCADTNTLQTCKPDGSGWTDSTCSLECATPTPPDVAHCKQFTPTAPVSTDDLDPTGLEEKALGTGRLLFDIASGAIADPSNPNPPLRGPNQEPLQREVISGIAFRRTNGKSIWTFKGITVQANTVNTFPAIVFGTSVPSVNNAVALLSTADISISGIIDVRGYGNPSDPNDIACSGTTGVSGPGGGRGGVMGIAAGGAGSGGAGTGVPPKGGGGGGAGYSDSGGVGGDDGGAASGGTAGAKYTPNPLVGGSGGGAGSPSANGGGGGGALQLVAVGNIDVNGGGVNAGGCGGAADNSSDKLGGGGGGSGGAILAEALGGVTINGGFLAANGGGGGGGGGGTNGEPGKLLGSKAAGGTGIGGGNGGDGGSAGSIKGQPGGGKAGGGGAAGRIRINTRLGMANLAGAGVLSPREADGAATQGLVDIR